MKTLLKQIKIILTVIILGISVLLYFQVAKTFNKDSELNAHSKQIKNRIIQIKDPDERMEAMKKAINMDLMWDLAKEEADRIVHDGDMDAFETYKNELDKHKKTNELFGKDEKLKKDIDQGLTMELMEELQN